MKFVTGSKKKNLVWANKWFASLTKLSTSITDHCNASIIRNSCP